MPEPSEWQYNTDNKKWVLCSQQRDLDSYKSLSKTQVQLMSHHVLLQHRGFACKTKETVIEVATVQPTKQMVLAVKMSESLSCVIIIDEEEQHQVPSIISFFFITTCHASWHI